MWGLFLLYFIFKLGKSEKDLIRCKICKDEPWTILFFPAKPRVLFELSAYPMKAISPDPTTWSRITEASASFGSLSLLRSCHQGPSCCQACWTPLGPTSHETFLTTISFLKLPPTFISWAPICLSGVAFTLPPKPTVMSDSSPSLALPFQSGPESPIPASGATIPFRNLSQQPRGESQSATPVARPSCLSVSV